MREAAGYVLVLPSDRQDAFRHGVDRGRFAEAVPEFVHPRGAPLVIFLSLRQGQITHVARGKRGWASATALRRLNCTDITELRAPLPVTQLVALAPPRLRRFVRYALNGGGLVPAKSFLALVEAVRAVDADTGQIVARFAEVRPAFLDRLTPAQETALALEKEATVTALRFAGFSTTSIQEWNAPETVEGVPSFLAGLPEARLREDAMVIHDLQHVPGWERIQSLPYGAVVFSNGSTRLTVIHANKQPLEEVFGADLIYYNDTYRAFVTVQYKVFNDEDQFRLPNKQLMEELGRMDTVLGHLRGCASDGTGKGYRLMENPFFLKLCQRVSFELRSTDVIKGMYVPFEYWKLLEQEGTLSGERGGRFVTPASVARYLPKEVFMSLVEHAWMGTHPGQSAMLEPIVAEILQSGRPLTIAVKTETPIDTDIDDARSFFLGA